MTSPATDTATSASASASTFRPARTAARSVLILVSVAATTHLLLSALPGDAADARFGTRGGAGGIGWRRQLRLDDPPLRRFAGWLSDAVQGDLGVSHITGLPVARSIADRLPVTLELIVGSQLVAITVAVAIAVAGFHRPGRLVDRVSPVASLTLLSIPTYLLAVVLLSVFAVRLGWFPVSDFATLGDGALPLHLRAMVLPVVALAAPEIAVYHRSIRAGLAATAAEPYLVAAQGRGISAPRMIVRHALPNAALAPLALVAPAIARTVGGAVLVEQIFSIPGLGRYALDAINARDQPAVLGTVVIATVVYLVAAAGTELAARRIDPRLRA